MIISGLFNNEQERVRTGIPYLQDIPILGCAVLEHEMADQ